jgi:light-regulated signal transduction histidine kinase (bacteriophytochrome)/CheY-like chemotaxis protein
MFSQLFSSHLEQQLERESVSRAKRAHSMLTRLESADSQQILDRFDEIAPDFLKSLDADGVAFEASDGWKTFGETPAEPAINSIRALADEDIYSSDCLTASGFAADLLGTSAGALVVPFVHFEPSSLVFFRNEIITEVRWAGTREKTIEHGPFGPRLHPRSSFEEYREAVRGRCQEWSRADLAAASEIRTLVLELLNRQLSSSALEWRKHRRQQDLLIAELNHRVKNILALVRSIARQTKDSASSLDEYAVAFESRIKALAFAHDLVGGRGGQQASLGELVHTELRPYEISHERVVVEGPPVALRPDAAPVMALVFHELASNAAKYGALAGEGGELHVAWHEEAGGVTIEWSERVRGNVTPPSRRGFGLALIERAIPYECHGESEVRYRSDGLEVRMWLPYEALTTYQTPRAPTAGSHMPKVAPLAKFGKALIVEDNMILTMEMERLLTEMGCAGVDSVPNNEEGFKQLRDVKYAVAILDVNLGKATSFELAEAALACGVPVLFVTGYGSHVDLPTSLAGAPCLSKPIDRDLLATRLSELNLGG